ASDRRRGRSGRRTNSGGAPSAVERVTSGGRSSGPSSTTIAFSRSMDRVLEHDLAGAPRLPHHRAELRDELERLPVLDEALELDEPVVEPRRLDRRTL